VIIETATFRLRDGVEEAAVRAVDHEVQVAFAHHQGGMLRRTTARSGDGEWLVVTLWSTLADAQTAAERAADDPACGALNALVEDEPVVRHYEDLGG